MENRKRRQAFNVPFQAHALTFSTYRRQPFLLNDEIAELFLQKLSHTGVFLRFEIWAYVVMPEHVHLLIRPREADYSVSAILKAVKSPMAKEVFAIRPEIKKRCKVVTPSGRVEYRFWQPGGGYDRNLSSGKATWNMIRYIHENPVRRGLCAVSHEWPFSSAGAYLDEPISTTIPVDRCTFIGD